MTETKPGFIATVKSFPATFWVANTMEIFERMAWYGFYALSSLYITGPVETGGLGFTSEARGQLQAIVPFFLYLFPVATGALADRYGYKKMFILAYLGMVVFYYALGQFKTFPMFLGAFMLVAISAAIFKPVVVGTVARVTDERNSAMGFGIFYMMVNIGGFVGPLVAGVVRGISWKYVFISCSIWAAINLLIVLIFYKEPTTEAASASRRTLGKVARDAVEVLGNLRFGITVFTVLIALILANQEFDWFSWTRCLIFIGAWMALNFAWDGVMPAGSGNPQNPASQGRLFFLKRMHCSNWRFALFLLIMSGFWTSFNQIFITMPEYIRDYTETKPMVDGGKKVFGGLGKPDWIDGLAAIEETELLAKFDSLVRRGKGVGGMVPFDPTDTEIEQSRIDALSQLKELRKKHSDLEITDLQEIDGAVELLKRARRLDPREKLGEVEKAEDVAARVDRLLKIRYLEKEPTLTPELANDLRQLAQRINAPSAKRPIEIVDLVEGARSILNYKVRIEPKELGELLAEVPLTASAISESDLGTAVKTINKRLELLRKPELEPEEAARVRDALKGLLHTHGTLVPQEALVESSQTLLSGDRKLEPKVLALGVRDLAYRPAIWSRIEANRQVNPEHIVNFDALAIVILQVFISFMMGKFHRFTTMIVGMVIAAVGIGLSSLAGGTMIGPVGGSLLVVVAGIVIFAIGEMMASPTSQEYVGRIAPRDKVATYMGYYFVAIALGNLFGGILSGQLYGKLARDVQRPDLMWMAFGGIMLFTAVVFMLYNKFALPRQAAQEMNPSPAH